MRALLVPITLLTAFATLPAGADGQSSAAATQDPACWVRGEYSDLELRASPFDSVSAAFGDGTVKLCYSRPRKLGRDPGGAGVGDRHEPRDPALGGPNQ